MVKIAFNSALAQKALGKEVPAAEKDPELASATAGSEGSTGRCLLTLLGIAFILSGLIVGGACLYRYFTPKRLYHGAMQFSDVSTGAGGESQPYYLPRVEEEVEISDSMAVISVPPPRFRPGDPAYILHDFNKKLTAYLDLTLRTCFVIPLNTSVVLPPQDLIDLFSQLMSGSYRSYLVHEDLVVTERIEDVKPLGFYIRRLCDGKETYRMQRRSSLPGGGIQKRSADECFTVRHFENKFVTETRICKA
ncbi:integral membrane protein 2A-like [Sander lucioperca]|uniref:Integral membrane protein 2 n=1 Tax=Sander lucioperca TaxID=283035 RepID=A0A8D0APL3_SANLU|nr:integral membrane protein 2A-like [Sander lucioperca]